MTEAREQLIEMQRLLGYAGYVDGIWCLRERLSPPVPKAFTRQWAWRREKVVNLQAYRKQAEMELTEVGGGMGLR